MLNIFLQVRSYLIRGEVNNTDKAMVTPRKSISYYVEELYNRYFCDFMSYFLFSFCSFVLVLFSLM